MQQATDLYVILFAARAPRNIRKPQGQTRHRIGMFDQILGLDLDQLLPSTLNTVYG
jgi:hypothetical protein